MKTIDEGRLETDLAYRVDYLRDFIEFGEDDVAAIQSVVGLLAPRINAIIDRSYEKLLGYDITARHFVQPGAGYDGPRPASVEDLHAGHEHIRFRKSHLRSYLMSILGKPYDDRMFRYLDMVARMHTPESGNPEINVPRSQMNVFMGLLSGLFIDEVGRLEIAVEKRLSVIKAFTKLSWIQSNLINWRY